MNAHSSMVQSATGSPHALAHSPKDNVAVVVVENLKAGTEAMIAATEKQHVTHY